MGNNAGCLGETCALAILIGGVYLIARRVIFPGYPCDVPGHGGAVLRPLWPGPPVRFALWRPAAGRLLHGHRLHHQPLYFWGRVVFAFGCGLITMVIREFGSLPEGVSYSIILMNILTPLLERAIKPRAFGSQRAPKGKKGGARDEA